MYLNSNMHFVRKKKKKAQKRQVWLIAIILIFVIQNNDRLIVCANKEPDEATQDTIVTSSSDTIDLDSSEESFFDPLALDPSCSSKKEEECYSPPDSTIETETRIDATCLQGGGDHNPTNMEIEETCIEKEEIIDKHWGSDPKLLKMRDQLRSLSSDRSKENKRPPIFLLPGLASTRLVAWKHKKCNGAFSSDIKVQDYVWLNINLILQMGTVNVECMKECLKLGLNQSDTDDWETGCKLRPDEGLDAIASLAPGGIGSNLLVGGTNTVYAWLINWLADNLGYDVTNIIGLPYDWRLTPNKMEDRDGFLTMTRKRIEAAVATNGQPGIVVAHSMGNVVLRYFLEWLRIQMRQEAYSNYVQRAKRRAKNIKRKSEARVKQMSTKKRAEEQTSKTNPVLQFQGWMAGVTSGLDGFYDWLTTEEDENEDAGDEIGEEGIDLEGIHDQLWELAVDEGDATWLKWVETHIWTYVGLGAPQLGAPGPLRSVISGETMGLPISETVARNMEVTFGSTHTVNPLSTSTGFCANRHNMDTGDDDHDLACLEDITKDIELTNVSGDPWKNFPALKAIMSDRVDWDTGKPLIDIEIDYCQGKGKDRCKQHETLNLSPHDVETGNMFDHFNQLWLEEGEPMKVKKEQLEQSFWKQGPNILNKTWDRPLIKHIIMAYGVDIPTQSGYIYNRKYEFDEAGRLEAAHNQTGGPPDLKTVLKEHAGGEVLAERVETVRGGIAGALMIKNKKPVVEKYQMNRGKLVHSGDGSVPYLSLSWAHTWLLHAARAKRSIDDIKVNQTNALDHIDISHRPSGASEWVKGPPPERVTVLTGDEVKLVDNADTGHLHGTRYKPEMIRYTNVGKSRTTGCEYTTSVIEAIGIEHKETTRNYDILAAVFTDILKFMHDDLDLV